MAEKTEREKLELAAKAAGLGPLRWQAGQAGDGVGVLPHNRHGAKWMPNHDDGDALRLAVKLRISFCYQRNAPPELNLSRECAVAVTSDGRWFAQSGLDEVAATRLAIFNAAVAIGAAMP